MRKQRTRRRYALEKKRATLEDPSHRKFKPIRMIDELGISVFRSIQVSDISEARTVFDDHSIAMGRQIRGVGLQKMPGVYLLQMREVVGNKKILGRVAVSEAMNAIYNEVPAIRRKRKVGVKSVELFGAEKAHVRPVCITFDKASTDKIKEERSCILQTIENLSGKPDEDFVWLTHATPNLGIGRINTTLTDDGGDALLQSIHDALPTEITLRPATLHDPTEK